MADAALSSLMQSAGLWLGFLVSLAIFSLIIRDNVISRLALHLLVGSTLGYAVLLVWQEVLHPRLLRPLLDDPSSNRSLFVPLALALMLAASGLERIFRPGRPKGPPPRWRQIFGLVGVLPVALVIGLTIAVIMLGSVQGTLAPQTLRAASTGLVWSDGVGGFLAGVLMLLITTGALLHVRVKPGRDLGNRPRWLQQFLLGWMTIGKHGLWLAAGVIFARLMASRFSLLIARFSAWAAWLEETGLRDWMP